MFSSISAVFLTIAFATVANCLDQNEFQVQISYKSSNFTTTLCGGVRLGANRVLTAAHCIKNRKIDDISVAQKSSQSGIASINIHPQYNSSTLFADLAMITLDGTPEDSYTPPTLPEAGQMFTDVVTFFRYGNSQEIPVRASKVTQLRMVASAKCKNIYGENIIQANMVCAGGRILDDPANIDGLCYGDAGSGITQTFEDKTTVLVGIGSFGFDCGNQKFPNVFTSIEAYRDWILEALN